LVTGGHGFIGRHVITALANAGASPIAVIHPSGSVLPQLPAKTITLDLEEESGAIRAIGGADMVVHLAARAGGIHFQEERSPEVFLANRRITDNILAASSRSGVKRVFLASSLVVYRTSHVPLTEGHPKLDPSDRPDPYAWSKITDEVAASWHPDLETVVGRFGNVYGPGASFEPDRSTVIHALIHRASKLEDGDELVVWGDGSAVRSFVFVEDVSRAVVACLASGEPGEAYNIDSGQEVTIAHLAEVIRMRVNPALTVAFDPSKPSGTPYRLGSIDKIALLGFAPSTPLDEGVRRTVEWHRQVVAAT
jgi:nucleoside-diphosphate-sugar epimerase